MITRHTTPKPSTKSGHPGFLTALLVLLLAITLDALGQAAKNAPHPLPPELRNRCAICHACTTPTKLDPCLNLCARVKESTGLYPSAEGPGVILMKKITREYGPVVFSHSVHAQMAEMSGGCLGCHHYNDTSLKILPCRQCHPVERKRENINVPDLKGVYHRRCLDCHRQWSGSADCKSCHLEKTEGKTPAQILEASAPSLKEHPLVEAPKKKVYATKEVEGSVVTFYHQDHITLFGMQCVDCHRQEGCLSCHDQRPPEVRTTRAAGAQRDFDVLHARCSSCHLDQSCEKCHMAAEAPPFDHARSSGWALKSYHARQACTRCHGKSGRFAGLKRDCLTCHASWETGSFAHAVTGLKLDDIHSAVDCIECHAEKAFEQPPTCSGCHPDKSYPEFKPGKATGK